MRESDVFVDNLKASLSFMSAETEKLYKGKLANLKLSREQWTRALDRIILDNPDGRLPQLANIFSVLNAMQAGNGDSNKGWAYIRLESGRSYVVRVECVDRRWRISDLTSEDRSGTVVHLQPNAGSLITDHVPDGTVEFSIHPDNPAPVRQEDMPTDEERGQYIAKIQANIAKIGSVRGKNEQQVPA